LEPLITLQSFSKMSGLLKLFKNSYRMDWLKNIATMF
jgi:hypothetical protein